MDDYSLTPEQEKALAALERAFKRCIKENVYVWSNYGTVSAVNGNIIRGISPDPSYEEKLDDSMVSIVSEVNLGDNADDQLYILYQ